MDTSGNSTSSSFTVTVTDDEAPIIAAHGNETSTTSADGTGNCSTTVSYTNPTATDNCDPVTVTCVPASGSVFTKGVTTVNCSTMDTSGNSTSSSFTVTVTDDEAPIIAAHGNETSTTSADGTGNCSTTVSYTNPTATDNCDPVTVTCVPASGSVFGKGVTTVNCSTMDTSGNSTSSSFTVTVTDDEAPIIAAHGNEASNT